MARNVVNIEDVSKAFDIKELLRGVSLGVSEGDRIGIVGRNGSGKSTLMKVMAGIEPPDSGRVTKSNSAKIGLLSQVDLANPESTVGEVVLGNAEKHEWASDPNIREVFTGLFGSFDDHIFDRKFGQLSGGERRRVGLAKLLINELDLILLDEPTNHLDVEGVAWLATYLNNRRGLAVVVVTHDRWFLDAVTERTWEVVEGSVEEYDGGYSAFVLSKAERSRQASVMDQRRNMLIKKELAWLRRGAPARTSKPKFRIDAANVLIADEPAPRDQGELLKFALNRLGKTVYEAHHVQVKLGDKELIDDLYWNVGPGDRIGIGYAITYNDPVKIAGVTVFPQVAGGAALIGDSIAIIMVYIIRSSPAGQRSGISMLQQIDPAIEEASASLGAAGGKTFRLITLPLISGAFLSGLMYAFAHSMTTLSPIIFLVTPDTSILTQKILAEADQGRYGNVFALCCNTHRFH